MQDVVTVVVLESGWAYCLWYAGGSLLSVVRWLDAAGWWSVGAVAVGGCRWSVIGGGGRSFSCSVVVGVVGGQWR
jgi:hypothetical protein